MEDQNEIHKLITAFLRKDISAEELNRLRVWLAENDRHGLLLKELQDKDILRDDVSSYASFDTSGRWMQLKKEISLPARGKRSIKIIWGSVAAVLILAVVGGLLFRGMNRTSQPEEKRIEIACIEPGSAHAILITASGQQVMLRGMKDTCLRIAGHETVEIQEGGSLKYILSTSSTMPEWHTLRVPRGGEYKIILDDSTHIWLNSESELHYPVHFVGGERRVRLIGEAYFQVARNESTPFIVETRNMDVKVLGTSFNISVYPDEETCHTTLVEGRVEVEDKMNGEKVVLVPGEQALLKGKEMSVREVNTKLYTLWRLDRFTFSSEDMEGVIRKLSRWYDADFFFANPSMKQKRFTGSLPKYTDIARVLKMIEMTTDVKFQVKENTIIIQ